MPSQWTTYRPSLNLNTILNTKLGLNTKTSKSILILIFISNIIGLDTMALLKVYSIKGVSVTEWCEFGQIFLFHWMGFRSLGLASVWRKWNVWKMENILDTDLRDTGWKKLYVWTQDAASIYGYCIWKQLLAINIIPLLF